MYLVTGDVSIRPPIFDPLRLRVHCSFKLVDLETRPPVRIEVFLAFVTVHFSENY